VHVIVEVCRGEQKFLAEIDADTARLAARRHGHLVEHRQCQAFVQRAAVPDQHPAVDEEAVAAHLGDEDGARVEGLDASGQQRRARAVGSDIFRELFRQPCTKFRDFLHRHGFEFARQTRAVDEAHLAGTNRAAQDADQAVDRAVVPDPGIEVLPYPLGRHDVVARMVVRVHIVDADIGEHVARPEPRNLRKPEIETADVSHRCMAVDGGVDDDEIFAVSRQGAAHHLDPGILFIGVELVGGAAADHQHVDGGGCVIGAAEPVFVLAVDRDAAAREEVVHVVANFHVTRHIQEYAEIRTEEPASERRFGDHKHHEDQKGVPCGNPEHAAKTHRILRSEGSEDHDSGCSSAPRRRAPGRKGTSRAAWRSR